MAREKQFKCMKYSTVIGSMLLIFPSGLFWYWANMSVYGMSFFVVVLNMTSGVETPWIVCAFCVFWIAGVSSSGFLAERVGRRCVALAGVISTDVGILLSYFTTQTSLATLTITMGATVGFGAGIADSSGLQMTLEWADKDTGTLTSAVQGTMCLGAFVINELITFYINPKNLVPDLHYGHTRYFTQKRVLNKVPTAYFVIGGFAVCSHILAFCFLRPKPSENNLNVKESPSYQCESGDNARNLKDKNEICENNDGTPLHSNLSGDVTPKDMLRTRSFHILWVTFLLGETSFTMVYNYYKAFGQVWIHDDHFLTAVGSASVLSSAVACLMFGVMIDKFGVKNCFLFYTLFLTVIQAWYFLSAVTGKWSFAIGTIALCSLNSTIFTSYTSVIALLYGKMYFTTNYGLLLSAQLCFNAVAPLFMEYLIDLGWFTFFAITAALNIGRIVLFIIGIPASI